MINHPITEPIARSWLHYREKIRDSRKNPNEENIHDLRVATQRFEAILKISQSLICSRSTSKLIKSLKKTRKILGPLRDLQVELRQCQHKNKTFFRFLQQKEKQQTKCASQYLKAIPLKYEKKLLQKLVARKFRKAENTYTAEKTHSLLTPIIKSSLLKLNQIANKKSIPPVKRVHKLRQLAKKLRYQEEAFESMFARPSLDLSKLKLIQSGFGKIQDQNALFENMNRYLSKKQNKGDSEVQTSKEKIGRRIESQIKAGLGHWKSGTELTRSSRLQP